MLNSIDIVIVIIFNSILIILTTVCSRKKTKKKKSETLISNTQIDGRRDIALQAIRKKCAGIVEEHRKKFRIKAKSGLSDASDARSEVNRYSYVECYDKSRVILKNTKNGYIHANRIQGFNYIVTQGPMTKTIVDFWLMCIQEKVSTIVQLCQFTESGETQCERYYPQTEGKMEKYGDFEIKYLKKKDHPIKGVIWAWLEIKTPNKTRNVDLIHVPWWSEKRIPDDPGPTMELSKWVEKQREDWQALAVCNSGEGRSVSFVAIMFTNYYTRSSVGVKDDMAIAIEQLRKDVPFAVKNEEDYLFLHASIVYSAMSEGMLGQNIAEPFLTEYKEYVRKNYRN